MVTQLLGLETIYWDVVKDKVLQQNVMMLKLYSEVVYNALLTDDSRCRREASNQTRPGDVYHPDFEHGLPAYFDLSVRSSLQPSFLTQAASHPGAASEAGAREKDERHHLNVYVHHRQHFSSARG